MTFLMAISVLQPGHTTVGQSGSRTTPPKRPWEAQADRSITKIRPVGDENYRSTVCDRGIVLTPLSPPRAPPADAPAGSGPTPRRAWRLFAMWASGREASAAVLSDSWWQSRETA